MLTKTVAKFSPPATQSLVILTTSNLPIQLWRYIIHRSLFKPRYWIAINFSVHITTRDATWQPYTAFSCNIRIRSPNTKWRNTKCHPRFNRLNGIIDIFDHHIDILTAPITHIHVSRFVFRHTGRILISRTTIWIKIIIHQDTIHIVIIDNISHHLFDSLTHFGLSRVKVNIVFIIKQPFWMGMLVIQLSGIIIACPIVSTALTIAIWIDPSMACQSTLVTLINTELQWIISRIYTTTMIKITGPWLIFRLIQSIACRTNVQKYGIHIRFHTYVQQL